MDKKNKIKHEFGSVLKVLYYALCLKKIKFGSRKYFKDLFLLMYVVKQNTTGGTLSRRTKVSFVVCNKAEKKTLYNTKKTQAKWQRFDNVSFFLLLEHKSIISRV